MHINLKKLLVVLSIILFLSASISFDKNDIRKYIYNTIDYLWTDFSLTSGLPGFYGRSNMEDFPNSWLGIAITLISEYPQNLPRVMGSFFDKRSAVNNFFIDVKFKDLILLEQIKERARANGFLSERKWFKFSGKFEEHKIFGRLRLKGDLSDHWRSSIRTSFILEFDKNSYAPYGFTTIAVQKPESRQYPYDAVFQGLSKDIEIIGSRHQFANVFFNGNPWGIMNIEERPSIDSLESQRRKPTFILKFGDDSEIFNIRKNGSNTESINSNEPRVLGKDVTKLIESNDFRKIYSLIYNNYKTNDIKLFNNKSYIDFLALALIWGSTHSLESNNSRHYWNPYIQRLEPYSGDQLKYELMTVKDYENLNIPEPYRKIGQESLVNNMLNERIDYVYHILEDRFNIHNSKYSYIFPGDKKLSFTTLSNNYNTLKKVNFHKLLTNKDGDISLLNNNIIIKHYTNGELIITNNSKKAIDIKSVLVGKINYNINKKVTPLINNNDSIIKTPFKGNQDSLLSVLYKFDGLDGKFNNKISFIKVGANTLNEINTTNLMPKCINKIKFRIYIIDGNKCDIKKSVKINGMLIIKPGSILNLHQNVSIEINGSLLALGTHYNKISINGFSNHSGGIYINSNEFENTSILEHLNIRNISNFKSDFFEATGAINFYKSIVYIDNVKFKNIRSEDSLNLVNSYFRINNLEIADVSSDGIDSDYSTGFISNSTFTDIGGDALDFSGSNVSLYNSNITNVKDKGLSAGESSTITSNKLFLNNIGSGIVSKDGSNVNAINVTAINSRLSSLMTYRKKNIYPEPAVLNIEIFKDGGSMRSYMRQPGSILSVEGVMVREHSFDSRELYKTGPMQKNAQ